MSLSARMDTRRSRAPRSLSARELAELAITSLEADAPPAPGSFERLSVLMVRFAEYLTRAYGTSLAADVRPEHVRAFLEANTQSGCQPAVATMHVRRSAIRLMYREAARLGAVKSDPTRDLPLPPRAYLTFRPLTDDEVELCRSFAQHDLSATRGPAAWALAEASARCSELPWIRADDIDLDGARVHIAGGAKTLARWGELNPWGLAQVTRRLSALKGASPGTPLVCSSPKTRASARASAYDAIRTIMIRAGLGCEPDLRPNSVAAWKGASALSAGASIDEVARMLGIRSLDAAASFIGWDWRGEGR